MEILIPLAPFIVVLGIVWIVSWQGTVNRRMTQETIREAIRSGQTLTPETIQALGHTEGRNKQWDLTTGAVLMAIAVAFVALGFALFLTDTSDTDILIILTGVATFPGLVGGVLYWLANKRKKEQD